MTAYDVHINRIPYSGTLTYRELPPLHTCNRPMLDVEQSLLRGHGFHPDHADYLFPNQRMLSRVSARGLGLDYHLLQIGDYDVSTIVTFDLAQNRPVFQGQRFSQIRFGSPVDLIIPPASNRIRSRRRALIVPPISCARHFPTPRTRRTTYG